MTRLERRLVADIDRPAVVSVLPLDQRTATSPVAAAIAIVLQSLTTLSVVAVDADGTAQPLRRLLHSTGAGDLIGLAASHSASLRRRSVEEYVDMGARVPLAACWVDGPGAVPPLTLRDAMWKLQRRFPTLVVDVPHGVPVPTISTASDLASHVVLVGDQADISHDWLHNGKSVVSRLAEHDAVTVVAIGGDDSTRLRCPHGDIVPVNPVRSDHPGHDVTADEKIVYSMGEVVARIFDVS